MIRKLLVANRGEIARRVFATARAMGIDTVAVYSDADADAPHVARRRRGGAAAGRHAGRHLPARRPAGRGGAGGPAPTRSTPGTASCPRTPTSPGPCRTAGLTWVGPPPDAIAAMGSKVEAKALLAKAGRADAAVVDRTGRGDRLPGAGQGVGRRRRSGHADRPRPRPSCPRRWRRPGGRPQAAFGDGTVFCERYVETGRHIEVQVFGDTPRHRGGAGRAGVLDPAPAPEDRRGGPVARPSTPSCGRRCAQAAVAAAEAVGYVGAGTVEFLLAPDGAFYFLEMNTRLQVEHPVTEARVPDWTWSGCSCWSPQGEPLPFTAAPPMRGHAIEVRLYAEDPAHGWLPVDRRAAPVRRPRRPARVRAACRRHPAGLAVWSTAAR